MSIAFKELDYRITALGELSLRRRIHPSLGAEVFEIKLGDEFLMSSLFVEGEIALAERALRGLDAAELDVVVGGLGLGYTAAAVLEKPHIRSLIVIEAIPEVIEWHRRGLVPLGARLTADPRCSLVQGDFFALSSSPSGFDPTGSDRKSHAILVDIDHSPRSLLHPAHAELYTPAGLRLLAAHLHPGGVFALWSNDPPDQDFLRALNQVFTAAAAHVVKFDNPQQDRQAANTIYVARTLA